MPDSMMCPGPELSAHGRDQRPAFLDLTVLATPYYGECPLSCMQHEKRTLFVELLILTSGKRLVEK